MRTIDEEIAHHLKEAAAAGELSQAKDYGKPLAENDGWSETPEALRMPFKILKNAGVPPPEIELFHERAALAARLRDCADDAQRTQLRRRLSEIEQMIAIRLETMRSSGGV
ncbi:MAG: DUF1992 domain-containing protein [Betaproteobacteria bacterium]|nr:DUF1992 domain-containing protein [Betaproteobacteria bacterium]